MPTDRPTPASAEVGVLVNSDTLAAALRRLIIEQTSPDGPPPAHGRRFASGWNGAVAEVLAILAAIPPDPVTVPMEPSPRLDALLAAATTLVNGRSPRVYGTEWCLYCESFVEHDKSCWWAALRDAIAAFDD